MEFRDYVRILRRFWTLALVLVLAGIATAVAYLALAPPRYEATATLLVSVEAGTGTAAELAQSALVSRQVASTLVSIATTKAVLDPVIDELALDTESDALAAQVTARSPLNTAIVELTVTYSDPATAAELANAVGYSLANQALEQLDIAEVEDSALRIEMVQPASVSAARQTPPTTEVLVRGLFGGAVTAVVVVGILYACDRHVRGALDIRRRTAAPIVGVITVPPPRQAGAGLVTSERDADAIPEFETIGGHLLALLAGEPRRPLIVTGTRDLQLTRWITSGVGEAIASAGRRVALVETVSGTGDGSGPQHNASENGPGAASGLTVVRLPGDQDPVREDREERSSSAHAFHELASDYDAVLLAAPSFAAVDSAILADHSTGLVLVVSIGTTLRRDLYSALRQLELAGADTIALIVVETRIRWWGAYQRARE